jgi:hypothetical protein
MCPELYPVTPASARTLTRRADIQRTSSSPKSLMPRVPSDAVRMSVPRAVRTADTPSVRRGLVYCRHLRRYTGSGGLLMGRAAVGNASGAGIRGQDARLRC